jgi:hypothetical protein
MQQPADIFGSLAVHRTAAGTWTSGRFVPGAETEISINACVQPEEYREGMDLEEGGRQKARIFIHSVSALLPLDEVAGTPADYVDWDGEEWVVDKVERYSMLENAHYRAVATRRQKT